MLMNCRSLCNKFLNVQEYIVENTMDVWLHVYGYRDMAPTG